VDDDDDGDLERELGSQMLAGGEGGGGFGPRGGGSASAC
jgi:hypothetical protein